MIPLILLINLSYLLLFSFILRNLVGGYQILFIIYCKLNIGTLHSITFFFSTVRLRFLTLIFQIIMHSLFFCNFIFLEGLLGAYSFVLKYFVFKFFQFFNICLTSLTSLVIILQCQPLKKFYHSMINAPTMKAFKDHLYSLKQVQEQAMRSLFTYSIFCMLLFIIHTTNIFIYEPY